MKNGVSLGKKIFLFLRTPYAIVIGTLFGIWIGIASKDISLLIAPVGEIYLTILQLCVFPILISAITVCVFKLLSTDDFSKYLSKMLVVFGFGFLMITTSGVLVTLLFTPGEIKNTTEDGLGELMIHSSNTSVILQNSTYEEISLYGTGVADTSQDMVNFFIQLVPKNIFEALVEGNSIQVLIFSIILGLSLGVIGVQKAKTAVDFFDSIFEAFSKVVMGLMYLLPFALCSLLAKSISSTGSDFLFAVAGLLVMILGICLVGIIMGFMVINFRTSHLTTLQTLKALREPLLVALVTANGLATIPSILHSLTKEMRYDEEKVALIVPIGIILGRFGTMTVFSIMGIYLAQVYALELSFAQIAFVIFSSILAGIATAGTPAAITVISIAIVLTPLGLPVETAIAIMLLMNPIIDPLLTVLNVMSNMLATTLIAKNKEFQPYGE
ncbi:dicarboxylate/amino acid:cation symporter [Sulfurospirillum barnesii]|uniref:Na+/H+ dicarboxylate symporter n=1 Tax=Sulfurospirillum barnesii (strain ATCC 700032 / DSM 10660 / SES-3) TaxID=760154 RepID=I3XVT4_SULBS|nr:cation:dicarboxylase symporter family transporter [Sulfurospirillum barnesii]AFL68058.1 Na+/H+ dicarboxylate symporter [Sulfurospirillum barnesii SES-3]